MTRYPSGCFLSITLGGGLALMVAWVCGYIAN